MRVDRLLVVGLALPVGAMLPLAPLPTALSALSIGALVIRRAGPWLCVLALVAAAFGATRARAALSAFDGERARARDGLMGPRRCAGDAVIVQSPVRMGGTMSFTARFESPMDCEGRAIAAPTLVRLYGGSSDLVRGDRIHVVAQLAPVRLFRNSDLSDPRPRASRAGVVLSGALLSSQRLLSGDGIRAAIDRARAYTRRRIDATFPAAAAPMARALVLGENDLDEEDATAFRSSGLSHLLAVSGTHLVFAVVAIVHALRALLARIATLACRMDVARIASAFGAVLALAYADFAGGSGSAWRAAWMLTAALCARAFGRRPSASRALAVSLIIGFISDPLIGFDISFVLSAAATAGLMVFGRAWSRSIRVRRRIAQLVANGVIATIASMLPCAPVLAMLGPTITLAGVVANVFAMPLGEAVALPLCLLHPLTGPIPLLEQGVALVASGALLAIKWLANASADATWAAIPLPPPGPWHHAAVGVGASGWLLASRSYKRSWVIATAVALVIVEITAISTGSPKGVLRITSLDVEQGDSTLVDLPDGSAMLVDAGGFVGVPVDPGEIVVKPVIRARRRSRVDVVVLSHPHPDHFGGLAAALSDVEVGEFWDTGQGRSEGAGPAYGALLGFLSARGVPIRSPRELCREPRHFGAAVVRVLSPCPDFEPGLDANDNSFVIKIELGQRAALLTGDAERHAEAGLLKEHGERLRADFLKVGHHGSRTSSSPGLLRAVRPEYAVISCGIRNRFGHPHPETLAALEVAGATVLRLDRTGSAQWLTNGEWQWVTVFGREP